MGAIIIKKAKIKDHIYLEVEYSEEVKGGNKSTSDTVNVPVHEDMKLAFKRLTLHLALLTEQVYTSSGKAGISVVSAFPDNEVAVQLDPDEDFRFSQVSWNIIRDMYCAGFTIGGSGDNEGVTLIGNRTLGNDKKLNLVSPFQKWSDEYHPYEHRDLLGEIIETCKAEVHAYLFENKHQPEAQLSLFGDPEPPLGFAVDENDPLLK